MPMNHFSQEIPEPVWWTPQPPLMESTPITPSSTHQALHDHHHPRATATATPSSFYGFGFNLNQGDDEEVPDEQILDEGDNPTRPHSGEQFESDHKEHMFEKPLTPSDVGKLNRLVIPKQYAEKYFPLGGGCDSGLLLSFEDESGKLWRFRYSYWNSSQSYVLTKGWSRFVKEKRLDAGDVVLFERHRLDCDRLFIGWRRRSPAVGVAQPAAVGANSGGVGGAWTRVFYSAHSYPSHPPGPSIPYQPSCPHAGAILQSPTTANGNSKTLRLFGVNMECQQPDESEPSTPDGSSISSLQGQAHYSTTTNSTNRQSRMDMKFSRAVNYQMRYHQG